MDGKPTEFKQGLVINHDLARYRYPVFGSFMAALPAAVVPEHLDRRPEMLPSSNQGSTSRCAAFAMAGCMEWYNWKRFGSTDQIDPNPIYEYAKQIDGMPSQEGTTLESVVRAWNDLGRSPFLDASSVFLVRTSPNQNWLKRALHRNGVVLAGFQISEGWRWAEPNGWIPSGPRYDTILGGHAVVLVGYDEKEKWYAVQNSWGETGYGWRGFVRLTEDQFDYQFMYAVTWDWRT